MVYKEPHDSLFSIFMKKRKHFGFFCHHHDVLSHCFDTCWQCFFFQYAEVYYNL